jgi:hypothetical protein
VIVLAINFSSLGGPTVADKMNDPMFSYAAGPHLRIHLKSRCSNVHPELKVLGISQIWVLGLNNGETTWTESFGKQNGGWTNL